MLVLKHELPDWNGSIEMYSDPEGYSVEFWVDDLENNRTILKEETPCENREDAEHVFALLMNRYGDFNGENCQD